MTLLLNVDFNIFQLKADFTKTMKSFLKVETSFWLRIPNKCKQINKYDKY